MKEDIKALYKAYETHYTFAIRTLFKTLGWLISNFQEEYI